MTSTNPFPVNSIKPKLSFLLKVERNLCDPVIMPRLPNPCKYKNKKKNKIKNRFVQTFKDGANSRSVVNNVKLLLFIKFSLVFLIQEQKKKKKKK